MTIKRPLSLGLSLLIALLGLAMSVGPAAATTIDPSLIQPDPSNLMICPLGTSAANLSGCTFDPNHIGNNGFIVFYNSNGNDKPTIGDPFDVIVAIPEINGVPVTPSPTLGSTALWSAGSPVTVTPTTGAQPLAGTFNSGDLYTFAFGGSVANNSWQFGNLQACDEAISPCVNPLSPPLSNVTGFEVFLWTINSDTPFFDSTQFLTFSANLPTGSFVTAFGLATETKNNKTTQVPVEAAFTNGGLVQPGSPPVPEPASLALLGGGLLTLAAVFRKRTRRN